MKDERVGLTSAMKVNHYPRNNTPLPSPVEISLPIDPTRLRSLRSPLDRQKLRRRRISTLLSHRSVVLERRKRMEGLQGTLIRNSHLSRNMVETIQTVMMRRVDLTTISGGRGNKVPIQVVLLPLEPAERSKHQYK